MGVIGALEGISGSYRSFRGYQWGLSGLWRVTGFGVDYYPGVCRVVGGLVVGLKFVLVALFGRFQRLFSGVLWGRCSGNYNGGV